MMPSTLMTPVKEKDGHFDEIELRINPTEHFTERNASLKRNNSMSTSALRARRTGSPSGNDEVMLLSRPISLHSDHCMPIEQQKSVPTPLIDHSNRSSSPHLSPENPLPRAPSTTGSTSSHEGNTNNGSKDDDPSIDQSHDAIHEARLFAKKKYFSERPTNKNIFRRYFHPTFHQRSIQFRKIFSGTVPDEDRLLYTFSCAFQREILAQGRIFISQQNVSFYANIFTWETLFAIPIKDIKGITKERAAKIFPNSIQIETRNDERFFFASFINREKTFTVLETVWKAVQEEKAISPEELWELMNPEEDEQKFPNSKVKKSRSSESMNKNHSAPTLSPLSVPPTPLSPPDSEFPSISEIHELAEPSECPCESHFGRILLDRCFDLPVDEMYTILFTDTPWFHRFNEQIKNSIHSRVPRGISDYAASDWTMDREGGRQRTVTYTVALNHAMAPKSCTVTETQVCSHLSADGFVVRKESHNSGVPYADSFAVLVTYCVTRVTSTSSRVRVHGGIDYRKSIWSMMKTFIEKNTNQGLDEHYAALHDSLRDEIRRRQNGFIEEAIRVEPSTSEVVELVETVEQQKHLQPTPRRERLPTFPRSVSVAASRVNFLDQTQIERQHLPATFDFYARLTILLLVCILLVNVATWWLHFRAESPRSPFSNVPGHTVETLAEAVEKISVELRRLKEGKNEL
ncbi:unnamed protein product, partial [Mesorhabditis belari]|uniref:VASt domain-containing protein n=1 Tax=Mesorhabditis belari TaxID=2138241 RepID=A0AAF3F3S7_9BILA